VLQRQYLSTLLRAALLCLNQVQHPNSNLWDTISNTKALPIILLAQDIWQEVPTCLPVPSVLRHQRPIFNNNNTNIINSLIIPVIIISNSMSNNSVKCIICKICNAIMGTIIVIWDLPGQWVPLLGLATHDITRIMQFKCKQPLQLWPCLYTCFLHLDQQRIWLRQGYRVVLQLRFNSKLAVIQVDRIYLLPKVVIIQNMHLEFHNNIPTNTINSNPRINIHTIQVQQQQLPLQTTVTIQVIRLLVICPILHHPIHRVNVRVKLTSHLQLQKQLKQQLRDR
jgi:hypothetical protein